MKRRDIKTLDYRTWSLIEYTLTMREELQLGWAYVLRLFLGGSLAQHMSIDLENLLCDYIPTRHRLVRHLNQKVL